MAIPLPHILSLVFGWPSQPLGLGSSPLGVQPLAPSGRSGSSCPAPWRARRQRIIQQCLESLTGDLAVPPLGTVVVHHQPHRTGAYPGGQAPLDPALLLVGEGIRPHDREGQPDAGIRSVGMLASRTRGGAEIPAEIRGWNDRASLQSEVPVRVGGHIEGNYRHECEISQPLDSGGPSPHSLGGCCPGTCRLRTGSRERRLPD